MSFLSSTFLYFYFIFKMLEPRKWSFKEAILYLCWLSKYISARAKAKKNFTSKRRTKECQRCSHLRRITQHVRPDKWISNGAMPQFQFPGFLKCPPSTVQVHASGISVIAAVGEVIAPTLDHFHSCARDAHHGAVLVQDIHYCGRYLELQRGEGL